MDKMSAEYRKRTLLSIFSESVCTQTVLEQPIVK